jgi:hypothetical protein
MSIEVVYVGLLLLRIPVLNTKVPVRLDSFQLRKLSSHRVSPGPTYEVFRARLSKILVAEINPGVKDGDPNPLIALLVLEPSVYSCVQVLECFV